MRSNEERWFPLVSQPQHCNQTNRTGSRLRLGNPALERIHAIGDSLRPFEPGAHVGVIPNLRGSLLGNPSRRIEIRMDALTHFPRACVLDQSPDAPVFLLPALFLCAPLSFAFFLEAALLLLVSACFPLHVNLFERPVRDFGELGLQSGIVDIAPGLLRAATHKPRMQLAIPAQEVAALP
ncbi:hypothetical protein RAS1_23010 [Phycisphaerae bacterium RAS1]|nr:hypothetical protein RAS1_23010 [Phycisphaerae bacterium RAS1]